MSEEIEKNLDAPIQEEQATKTKAKGKKNKRVVTAGQLHIQATFNNTIITVTDKNGGALSASSAGANGFRGSKKGTAYAAQIAAEKALETAKREHGLNSVDVYVSGIGLGRDSAIRAVSSTGLKIDSITDVTPIAHGGVRPKGKETVMARDISPIVKQSRREGYALAPKAHKIMAKKSGIPGEHSDMRVRGGSLYLTQLREKQKVRRLYGLLEKQFAKLMSEAAKADGLAGENLLQYLERRADNAVYRAGFATTRRQARQLVSHGHFLLNGRRVDIPSIRLKPGDVLEVRPKSQKSEYFKNLDNIVSSTANTPLSWLKSDPKKMKIEITGLPKREEAEAGINEQLIVEYYSR